MNKNKSKKKQVWLFRHEWAYVSGALETVAHSPTIDREKYKNRVGELELLRLHQIVLRAALEENKSGANQPDSVASLRKQA